MEWIPLVPQAHNPPVQQTLLNVSRAWQLCGNYLSGKFNSNAWSLYPRDCQASRMSSRSGISGVRYSVTLINCDFIFTLFSGFGLVQTYADKVHQDNEHRLVRAQRMYVRRTRKHHCGSLALSVNQDCATFMITSNMFSLLEDILRTWALE